MCIRDSYLTILTEQKKKDIRTDVIVLNSTALLDIAIGKIKDSGYSKIYAMLDNDEAGKTALETLKNTFDNVVDLSYLYEGFNDPNEKWTSEKVRLK